MLWEILIDPSTPPDMIETLLLQGRDPTGAGLLNYGYSNSTGWADSKNLPHVAIQRLSARTDLTPSTIDWLIDVANNTILSYGMNIQMGLASGPELSEAQIKGVYRV